MLSERWTYIFCGSRYYYTIFPFQTFPSWILMKTTFEWSIQLSLHGENRSWNGSFLECGWFSEQTLRQLNLLSFEQWMCVPFAYSPDVFLSKAPNTLYLISPSQLVKDLYCKSSSSQSVLYYVIIHGIFSDFTTNFSRQLLLHFSAWIHWY